MKEKVKEKDSERSASSKPPKKAAKSPANSFSSAKKIEGEPTDPEMGGGMLVEIGGEIAIGVATCGLVHEDDPFWIFSPKSFLVHLKLVA